MKLYNKLCKHLTDNNCVLLTKEHEYKNRDTIIKYIGTCGHNIQSYCKYLVKKKIFKCKNCLSKKSNPTKEQKIYQSNTNFLKRIQKFEHKFNKTHKYRLDFTEERYFKTLTCWDCKREKPMRYFPYRIQYKYNKEKRCKSCNNINHLKRRQNITKEQFIINILNTTKRSSTKRHILGREEASIHTITYQDIIDMIDSQQCKCKLSGIKMEFSFNNLNKLSIDRIDSEKGYTKDNIQLVTWAVNQAKNNLTNEQFINLVKHIYNTSCT